MFLFSSKIIRRIFSLLLFFALNFTFGQDNLQNKIYQNNLQKIEELILKKEYLNAVKLFKIMEFDSLNQYHKILNKIALQQPTSYKEYYTFLISASAIPGSNNQLSDFINNTIQIPETSDDFNYEYVKIKWLQMMALADETATLDEARIIKVELLKYIDSYSIETDNVNKARALVETFEMVIYVIQNKIELGKELCQNTFEIGKELNDKLIQITSLYHLCDFLVADRNLEEFITQSEVVLELESGLATPSPYKAKNMVHLIDAYIFKGGNHKRVSQLLNQLYNDVKTRPHSYSLYAQFLTYLPKDHKLQKEIFKIFNVKTYPEFGNKIDSISQNVLVPNDYYHVLNFTSKLLYSKKLYAEAFRFKDKAIDVTRKTYSEDLSQSLADFQTEKAVQQKERELLLSKQKSKYYGIIASLVAALFGVSLLLLYFNTKKNKILKQKNNLISNTLLEKERLLNEKQLLFKEMHHRVKNNFQLLSSLLELQVTGIEDKNALKMVEEGQNRIKSMALIHQNLYKDDSLKISLSEYVNKLIAEISAIGTINPRILLNIPNYKFDIDTAIPLGLILNELITNCFKYGFTNKYPSLTISIEKEKESSFYKLILKDNGNGLNSKEQFLNPNNMGLWLVQRLVKQLSGKCRYSYDNGAVYTITFKDTGERLKVA
ncbi:hypothetical protein GCM10011414_15130 [Croceivirga lutea]|nr:hypothetical protein GCM10011414_15130 [Croceivirga lutea]